VGKQGEQEHTKETNATTNPEDSTKNRLQIQK
jgi:hypothetical protein